MLTDFALGSSLPHHPFLNEAVHGPSRDAAEFMAELKEENPECYETWLKLKSRDEFNEKFRRSFISALCRFCINRKQMELARYRRDFVQSVLSYTKAEIGVNVFCDKNGGGFLNNSLKSRRAYQKRRRESNWQEQTAPAAVHESTFSSLLRSFQQHNPLAPPPPAQRTVADLLTHADRLRSPSPLIQTAHLLCEATEEHPLNKERSTSSCASASSSSASSLLNVFVRYKQVSEDWRDVDVKQTKFTLNSFATVETLFSALISKWQLEGEEGRLVLRSFDRDFNEFVDIEEEFGSIGVENLAKFELVHRKGGSETRATASSSESPPPPNGLVGLLNELSGPKANDDDWIETLRSASSLFHRPEEAGGKCGQPAAFFQSIVQTNSVENVANSNEEFTSIDLISVLGKTDYGRLLLQQLSGQEDLHSAAPPHSQPINRKRPRPLSPSVRP